MGVTISSPVQIIPRDNGVRVVIPNEDDFEEKLTKETERRSLNWCRLCMRENCLLENEHDSLDQSPPSNVEMLHPQSEELPFIDQLQKIKQKRRKVFAFLDRAKTLSDVGRLAISRLSYFGAQQYGIPLSLYEVLDYKNVLVFRLVPLFSNLGNTVKELNKHVKVGMSTMSPEIRQECSQNLQGQRRVTLSLMTYSKQNKNAAFSNRPTFRVTEENYIKEITSPQNVTTPKLHRRYFVPEARENEETDGVFTELCESKSSRQNVHETKSDSSERKTFQSNGNKTPWNVLFESRQASITENRTGRFLIEGNFPTRNSSSLPFKLIVFSSRNSITNSLTFSGTFIRLMETAKFSLRWKFHVDI